MELSDVTEGLKWALVTLLGGLVAILKWTANRLHARVDAMEKEKASIASLTELRAEVREHRNETKESLREINGHLMTIVSRLK